MMSLAVFVTLFFFYCLISQRLERTVVTAPIVFTVAGMLMFPALPGILKAGVNTEVLFRLSETGLVFFARLRCLKSLRQRLQPAASKRQLE